MNRTVSCPRIAPRFVAALLCAGGCSGGEQTAEREPRPPSRYPVAPADPAVARRLTARPSPPPTQSHAAAERAILREMNRVRGNPAGYVGELERVRRTYDGYHIKRPGRVTVLTFEGVAAVDDAIRALRRAPAVHPLRHSAAISRAARDHVRDLGPKGKIGHGGSDGSSPNSRLRRYGRWRRCVGENVHGGGDDGKDVVIGLLVDDGVANRMHRKNILDRDYHLTGIACGPHSKLGRLCVIDFAGGFVPKR